MLWWGLCMMMEYYLYFVVVVVVFMGGFHWVTSMFFPNLLCKMIGEMMECTQVSHYTTSIPICSHGSRVHTSIGGTITTYYYFQCLGFIDTQIVVVSWTNPFSTQIVVGGGEFEWIHLQGGSFHPSIVGTYAWMIFF